MTAPWLAVAGALVAGVVWGLATPAILRWLPEPEGEDHKIRYVDLATRPFAMTVGTLTVTSGAVAVLTVPAVLLPLWLVLGTLGQLLAAIDARTTWLPLALTRVAWVAMAVAVAAILPLAGWQAAVRGVVGFAVTGALFGLIWMVTRGGFGFGDVRFAPLVGAATASVSWTLLASGLVLGSLVGAVVGLVRLAMRRPGSFAYAPSILAGGYLAAVVAWLTT